MMRPNYRRARALALEIEATRDYLADAKIDPSVSAEEVEDLKAELHRLQHEFFLTGVTSEYDL